MTEEELNELKFRECSHITYDDEYHVIYECMSEPLVGRLKVSTWVKRDKQTGMPLAEKPLIHYGLDGKLYEKKAEILEVIKRI